MLIFTLYDYETPFLFEYKTTPQTKIVNKQLIDQRIQEKGLKWVKKRMALEIKGKLIVSSITNVMDDTHIDNVDDTHVGQSIFKMYATNYYLATYDSKISLMTFAILFSIYLFILCHK